MDNTIDTALLHNQARREHILNQVGDNMLEKAISENDFNEQYGTEHEVYTSNSLLKCINDTIEEHGQGDEVVKALSDQFNTLSPVIVKKTTKQGTSYSKMFVRKMVETEEEENQDETDA